MITFGSYVFPAGFRLASQQLDSKIDDVALLGIAGSQAPPGLADVQTITLEGSIGGGEVGSAGAALLSSQLVKAELVTMMQAVGSGYQWLNLGDVPARQIRCQKKTLSVEREEGYGQRFAVVKIAFEAVDPRFLSVEQHTIGENGSAVNAGDAPSFPVVTFQGPATNPAVSVDVGPGTITVTCTVTLAATDILTINCDPRQRMNCVVLNGVPRLDLLGTTGLVNTVGNSALFPYLVSGSNGVGFAGLGSGAAVNFAWSDAWSI